MKKSFFWKQTETEISHVSWKDFWDQNQAAESESCNKNFIQVEGLLSSDGDTRKSFRRRWQERIETPRNIMELGNKKMHWNATKELGFMRRKLESLKNVRARFSCGQNRQVHLEVQFGESKAFSNPKSTFWNVIKIKKKIKRKALVKF